jgi:hypothetical protein
VLRPADENLLANDGGSVLVAIGLMKREIEFSGWGEAFQKSTGE